MKNLILSTTVTFFLSIGLGFKAEAQRLLDVVPEHVQFQHKLIEDAITMNTYASVDNRIAKNFRVTENTKSNKKTLENIQTAVIAYSNNNNTKSIAQPIGLPTPTIKDMAKEVYVKSYKVDYKGGTRYFPSSVEGESFMRQLNNDYQNNLVPNPGNVIGYYTSSLAQGLVDYGRWYNKSLEIK
jgi:hypothetical protein